MLHSYISTEIQWREQESYQFSYNSEVIHIFSPADKFPDLPTQLGVSEYVYIMFLIQLWDAEITV